MASDSGDRTTGFRFRRLDKPEEYRTAEELQLQALGDDAHLAVPASVLRSLQDTGGLVLGAFVDIYLAGVSASSIGWDGTTLYHHLLAAAVRPEYQAHRVASRLLGYHRGEVLALGLGEIRGSIDPVQSRAAYLAVHRLGARPDAFRPNFFGRRTEGPTQDPETDRLHLRWVLGAPAVEQRLADGPPSPEVLVARWQRSAALIETEPGDSGLRLPKAVTEPDPGPAHLEIPFDLGSLRTHEAASVRRWRHAVRDAFRIAFDLGFVADEFAVLSIEHERRGFYLLRPAADATVAGSPPPAG